MTAKTITRLAVPAVAGSAAAVSGGTWLQTHVREGL